MTITPDRPVWKPVYTDGEFLAAVANDIWSYYDCYSFKIIDDPAGYLTVRFQPSLYVLVGPSLIFEGSLAVDVHFTDIHSATIKPSILQAAKASHAQFIKYFRDKTVNSHLSPFEPKLDEIYLNQTLDHHLHSIS